MEEAEIFLVTGIPGAGKTTTSRALAASFAKGVHIPGDTLSFGFVVSGLVDPFDPDEASRLEWDRQMVLRRKHQAMLAQSFASAGFTAVIDDVVTHPNGLAQMIRDLSQPIRVVVLAPPLEVVARRDSDRETHVFEKWHHLDRQLRSRMDQIGLWIEDGALSVEAVVETILADRDAATVQPDARLPWTD